MTVDHEALERRYLRLLRWYPPAYRQARGSEILDTLMESADPGRRHPTAHERRALVLGGLRARTGANHRRSRTEVWLGGLRLGALLLLVHAAAATLADTGRASGDLATGRAPGSEWALPVILLLAAGALVLLAAGRLVPALALTVGGIAAQQVWAYGALEPLPVNVPWQDLMSARVWQLPLAAALLVLLALQRPSAAQPPATPPWRWLLAVPVGMLVLLPIPSYASVPSDEILILFLLCGPVLSLIDVRIPIAVTAVLFAYTIPDLVAGALQIHGDLQFVQPPFTIPLTSTTTSPVTFYLTLELALTALLLTTAVRRATQQTRI
jgi:hypothetical protein